MNIMWLKEYIELANSNSYREAAEKLYISQSSLSKHILKMESELNTQLLRRQRLQKNSVNLTESGHLFYTKAKEIVEMYENAAHELNRKLPPRELAAG